MNFVLVIVPIFFFMQQLPMTPSKEKCAEAIENFVTNHGDEVFGGGGPDDKEHPGIAVKDMPMYCIPEDVWKASHGADTGNPFKEEYLVHKGSKEFRQ
jgi:hypothetical protein